MGVLTKWLAHLRKVLEGGRMVKRIWGMQRAFEFGRTYVVRPKGKHQATIIWFHGLRDNGSN
ncbi:hypothetical protein Fmac_000489 [Flemingia macrophylla]|uniref:Uncharacterized protein n=1 Tax=Flemingia macrophylla TaxID=520843 RepID=A0ABD1NEE6_9FABA